MRLAGGILEKAGSISPKYTQAMVDAVREMGPYMAILPNFALAHAAPSDDVFCDDFSLIILKEPVNFGSANDPIYVILAFCSTDGKSHMGALNKIAKLLMQDNTVERLIKASTVEEVSGILEEKKNS